MKKETAGAILSRIKLGELQVKRLALLIRFPPPGCRSAEVWRQVQSDALCSLRARLVEDRRELARLTSQLELDWSQPKVSDANESKFESRASTEASIEGMRTLDNVTGED